MWLLKTVSAELKFFAIPELVPGGYAILSHTWDEHEDTFQDVQAFRTMCTKAPAEHHHVAESSTNTAVPTNYRPTSPLTPRDLVSDKIRNFCILAEEKGYEYGWADTCCIDKTNSADLSEAINSMYRYYSLTDVCFAYLRDVRSSSIEDLKRRGSEFWKSRWHRRGWTLQELIAPEVVVFLSQNWEILGTKADLAEVLGDITKVPVPLLKSNANLGDYSIADRMAWGVNRETTRLEDEAYSLMGIFGIFMPPLYGEGRNAFFRLQEEIMKHFQEPLIFAWGPVHSQTHTTHGQGRTYDSPPDPPDPPSPPDPPRPPRPPAPPRPPHPPRPPAPTVPLLRAHSPSARDHFYTTDTSEMKNAVTNLGYRQEGNAATVHPNQTPNTIPLYRLWSPSSRDHFYTTSASERDNAVQRFKYSKEGIAAYVYGTQLCGTVPLYRMYSSSAKDHFYTTNAAEKDNAVKNLGYSYEGIAAYVKPQHCR